VRREDLYDSGSDHEVERNDDQNTAELQAKLSAKLSSLLGLKIDLPPVTPATPTVKPSQTTSVRKDSASSGKKKKETPAKIEKKKDDSSSSDSDTDTDMDDDDNGPATPGKSHPSSHPQEHEPEEAEFEFRLFSTTAPSAAKIVLAPTDDVPDVVTLDGSRVGPDGQPIGIDESEHVVVKRPDSYYFRGQLTPEQQAQIQLAAVSAAQIAEWSRQRAWGLERPWRVTKLVVSKAQAEKLRGHGPEPLVVRRVEAPATGKEDEKKEVEEPVESQTTTEAVETKAKKKIRPCKRRRIRLRIKFKEAKKAEEIKMTKEEHLKEKKRRLNREKKLKRRQKEKEKKMAMAGGSANGGSVAGGGSVLGADDSDSD